jgi:hypothetical protein
MVKLFELEKLLIENGKTNRNGKTILKMVKLFKMLKVGDTFVEKC